MALKYLGKSIDIHGGGEDLKFPHHENELAQSEVYNNQKFVNYWMHNGLVTAGDEQEKMSKSLGNFRTVKDVLKDVEGQTLRFWLSMNYYRKPVHYSDSNIEEAKKILDKLIQSFVNLKNRLNDKNHEKQMSDKISSLAYELEIKFIKEMDDDFNTPNGLVILIEFSKLINNYEKYDKINFRTVNLLLEIYKKMLYVYGVESLDDDSQVLDADIEDIVDKRDKARAVKNFEKSDQLREELKSMGVLIEDTSHGTRWRRL